MPTAQLFLRLDDVGGVRLLHMQSPDGLNLLSRAHVKSLIEAVEGTRSEPRPLIITGTERYFSVGADLQEIARLDAVAALEFSHLGQRLMLAIENSRAPVWAAIRGYCMGGGLDLALACHFRAAAPGACFGHRGAALGLITGWGGTQRLPLVVGKAKALQMFAAAEKIEARDALRSGLVDQLADDPVRTALEHAGRSRLG